MIACYIYENTLFIVLTVCNAIAYRYWIIMRNVKKKNPDSIQKLFFLFSCLTILMWNCCIFLFGLLLCKLVSLNSLSCMSDLQVVVKFCLQGLWLHFVCSRDASSLTDALVLIKNRPQLNVWITNRNIMVIKIQDQPTASCRGKETDTHDDSVHHQIRFGPFNENTFSLPLPCQQY